MGLDFIRGKAKGFTKMYDGGREMLASPDLLSPAEQWEEQLVLFDVHQGCTPTEGEELLVQISGATLVALRGHDAVATAANPPEAVMIAVRRAMSSRVSRASPP